MGKIIKLNAINTLNERTRDIYEKECNKFRKNFFFLYGFYPECSDSNTIQSYLDQCYPALIKHSSVFKVHVAAVRKWYSGQTFADHSLMAPRVEPDPLRVLSVAEVREIFKAARSHPCSLMLRLIYESGIRLQEVTRIRIRDIDFDSMLLSIEEENNSGHRHASIPDEIKYDLMRLSHKRDSDEFIFTLRITRNGTNSPISRRTLQQFLNRISERAGLGRINTQTLRDSYAIHMMQKGYDLRLIMNRMGLKSARSMQRYMRYMNSPCEKAPVLRSPLSE